MATQEVTTVGLAARVFALCNQGAAVVKFNWALSSRGMVVANCHAGENMAALTLPQLRCCCSHWQAATTPRGRARPARSHRKHRALLTYSVPRNACAAVAAMGDCGQLLCSKQAMVVCWQPAQKGLQRWCKGRLITQLLTSCVSPQSKRCDTSGRARTSGVPKLFLARKPKAHQARYLGCFRYGLFDNPRLRRRQVVCKKAVGPRRR